MIGKVKRKSLDGEHWTVECTGECEKFYIDKAGKRVIPKIVK